MPRTKSKERLVIISVHLPRQMIEELDGLVMRGVYPSRSEAIREAIMRLVMRRKTMMVVNRQNNNDDKVIAKVICENGHVIAHMRLSKVPLTERIRALQIASLVCPICHSANLFVEFKVEEVEENV